MHRQIARARDADYSKIIRRFGGGAFVWISDARSFCAYGIDRVAVRQDNSDKTIQRYEPIELGVIREIHFTHATGADSFDDAVMRDVKPFGEDYVRYGFIVVVLWHV